MVGKFRRIKFEFKVDKENSIYVMYKYHESSGAGALFAGNKLVREQPKFVDGREKFFISETPCELNVEILEDREHRYTLNVGQSIVMHKRDPFYKWIVIVDREQHVVTYDTGLAQLQVNDDTKETEVT